jgi:hypothetical protein
MCVAERGLGLSSRTSATTFWKGYKALWLAASALRHIFVLCSYADRPTKNELETYGWGSVLARTTRGDRGPPIEQASVSSNVVLGGSGSSGRDLTRWCRVSCRLSCLALRKRS